MANTSDESDSTMEFSEDTEQALIEAMETQIDDLQAEVKQLRETIHKLNKKLKTFQSIVKSDLIAKVFKYL